ncbi:hypothetical protein POVCU2_0098000, partial [Plasmodium ovale curtisi]
IIYLKFLPYKDNYGKAVANTCFNAFESFWIPAYSGASSRGNSSSNSLRLIGVAWRHLYSDVRGEILRFSGDKQLRKHLPKILPLIKNEIPYEKSKSLGSGASIRASEKVKRIDGRAPPGFVNMICLVNSDNERDLNLLISGEYVIFLCEIEYS